MGIGHEKCRIGGMAQPWYRFAHDLQGRHYGNQARDRTCTSTHPGVNAASPEYPGNALLSLPTSQVEGATD